MARDALFKQSVTVIEPYLKKPGLVELIINKPGELWLETTEGWKKQKEPGITEKWFDSFISIIATLAGQKFNESIPMLATHLPEYGYRIQAIGGRMSDTGLGLAIRVGAARVFPLESYMSETEADKLREAIRNKKTIIVAGGTSSGKTTFLNGLIQIIPKEQRIIAVEDTKELTIPHDNLLRLMKSKTGTDIANITYKDIINSCMRLRPDRLIMGELDIENTLPFLRMINTGHGGAMATLHADTADSAIDALILNTKLAGIQASSEDIRMYATNSLDAIVHLSRQSRTKYEARTVYFDE